jgi:hypothetical protein
MPTGITGAIYNGDNVSPKDFIMTCSKQFGAMYHMRDERADAPIKYPTFTSYHVDSLKRATEELAKIEAMTVSDAMAILSKERARKIEEYDKIIADRKALELRYLAMMDEVKLWTPPTSEHEGIKTFAIDQLKSSIDHDCRTKYYEDLKSESQEESPEEYLRQRLMAAERDIKYHEENHAKELQSVAERTKWITDLQDSLEGMK